MKLLETRHILRNLPFKNIFGIITLSKIRKSIKILQGILFLFLISISSPANSGQIGSGELKLANSTVKHFIEYIKTKKGKPLVFFITVDGRDSLLMYCPYSQCLDQNFKRDLKKCKSRFKKECKVFARKRTIKWQNGINKGNKESRFGKSMNDSEFRVRLKELGFLE